MPKHDSQTTKSGDLLIKTWEKLVDEGKIKMSDTKTTLRRKQLDYLKKVFEKFHTPNAEGIAEAHHYAERVLDCMPKEEGCESI